MLYGTFLQNTFFQTVYAIYERGDDALYEISA